MTADPGQFWLRGDESGGVALMCRECDAGGAPLACWDDPPATPEAVRTAARRHFEEAHAPDPELVACSFDWPLIEDQVLGWAQQARWFFDGYYKYGFTFESSGTIAMPDDPEAREFEATASVSGGAGDIYRFRVQANEPMTWEQISYVRTPDLVIRDTETGEELMRITGDD